MAQHRYRQNKIKREHTIVPGILPYLEAVAAHPDVHAITPGRIKRRVGNDIIGLKVQYETDTGLKLLALSNRAVQEVFVVTDEPQRVLAALKEQGTVTAG